MNSPSASASATPYDQFEFSAAISRHTPALTCQLKTCRLESLFVCGFNQMIGVLKLWNQKLKRVFGIFFSKNNPQNPAIKLINAPVLQSAK